MKDPLSADITAEDRQRRLDAIETADFSPSVACPASMTFSASTASDDPGPLPIPTQSVANPAYTLIQDETLWSPPGTKISFEEPDPEHGLDLGSFLEELESRGCPELSGYYEE